MIKNRLTEGWDGFLLLIKAFPHGEGQRVKKAPNIRCHSEPVRRLVWESPG